MNQSIISRVGWCPECYKAQRPRTDNFFVVIGDHGYHIKKAAHIGNTGFTPHVLKMVSCKDGIVKYKSICGMHDCGVEVFWVPSKDEYNFRFGTWKLEIMTVENWEALCGYRRDLDYFVFGIDV